MSTAKVSDGIAKGSSKKTIEIKNKKPASEKIEGARRLVHLLQVHQIELEHQNQELRITQEELEVSRNKYVNLFDFSPIPYFTLNPEGIIAEVNLRASKMFELDRKRLISKQFSSFVLFEDKDVFNVFLKAVFESPVKHSCELRIVNKNKKLFHVLVEGLKLENTLEAVQQCQIALIDMTEYKKVEESLLASNEKLSLINNTKDKLFSIISHDLRSPFQGLLSSSELMATELEKLTHDEIASFSQGLNINLKNLYSLLENLLHWSLMQRNKLEYAPVNIVLSDLVNKVISTLTHSAAKKNITITNNIKPAISIFADAEMIRSVFLNLIINSIKFTNTGGSIIISAVEKGDYIEISVQDNGIGMKPEISSKLFSFNTIFSTNGTAGEKGTGLGLPLCKEFIERNEGKIWVESELKDIVTEKAKGSKFIFTLRKAV